MNERLQALAAQAKLNGVEFDTIKYYVGTEETFLAFAKLIIRECADIASINAHQYETPGSYVLKHFGVEE